MVSCIYNAGALVSCVPCFDFRVSEVVFCYFLSFLVVSKLTNLHVFFFFFVERVVGYVSDPIRPGPPHSRLLALFFRQASFRQAVTAVNGSGYNPPIKS